MVIKKSNSAFNTGNTQRVKSAGFSTYMNDRFFTPDRPPRISISRAVYRDQFLDGTDVRHYSFHDEAWNFRTLKDNEWVTFETLDNYDNAEACLLHVLSNSDTVSRQRRQAFCTNYLEKDTTVFETCKDLGEQRKSCTLDKANTWKILERIRDLQEVPTPFISSILQYADILVTEYKPFGGKWQVPVKVWSAYDAFISSPGAYTPLTFASFLTPTGFMRAKPESQRRALWKTRATDKATYNKEARAWYPFYDFADRSKRKKKRDPESLQEATPKSKAIPRNKRSSTRGLQRPAMWAQSTPSNSKKKLKHSDDICDDDCKDVMDRPKEVINISLITPDRPDSRDLNVNFVIKKLGHQPYNEPHRSTHKRKCFRRKARWALKEEIRHGREHHAHLNLNEVWAAEDCSHPEADFENIPEVDMDKSQFARDASRNVFDILDLCSNVNRKFRKTKHSRRHFVQDNGFESFNQAHADFARSNNGDYESFEEWSSDISVSDVTDLELVECNFYSWGSRHSSSSESDGMQDWEVV